jgi:hypothetical protein
MLAFPGAEGDFDDDEGYAIFQPGEIISRDFKAVELLGKGVFRSRQDKTITKLDNHKTRQDKTRQDKTRQKKTRQDKTRQSQNTTRQDNHKTRQDKTITKQDNHKTRQVASSIFLSSDFRESVTVELFQIMTDVAISDVRDWFQNVVIINPPKS